MTRSRTFLALVGALAAVVLLAGGWYLFLRPTAPSAVGLPTGGSAAAASPAAPTAQGGSGAGSSSGPGSTGASGTLAGTWKVDQSIGSFADFSSSFAGYRVQETLANIGATTAVGRTPNVSGSLTLDGVKVVAAEFTADLTTLKSDSDFRDGQLGRQGIQTATFPTATFRLAEPIDLGTLPGDGATFSAAAKGELTLHGVTKSVLVPLQARLSGGVVTVTGSLAIAFSDYGIAAPSAMRVLSIEDHGTMEFQLHFVRG